ncbi:MAG: hypothetical protein QM820_47135 [Minicystis sp.]
MSFTLAGNDLQAADVQILGYGIWTAEVSLADARPLTSGSGVQLVLSDLTMEGTIRSGGEFVGETRYFVVGGADGWAKTVKRRAYRADNGIRLSQVAQDLAAEVGETVVVLPAAERVVGYAWQRLGGSASAALSDLAGSSSVGRCRREDVRRSPPGLEGPNLDAVRGRELRPEIQARRHLLARGQDRRLPTRGDLYGGHHQRDVHDQANLPDGPSRIDLREGTGMKGFMEDLRDLVAHWTRKTRFYGFYPYKVDDEAVERVSLKAIGVVDGLPSEVFPDQLHVDKAHGIAGVRSTLTKDSIVLVGFKGGDPGSPFVAFYLPGQPLPMSVQLDAQQTVKLGQASHPAAYGDLIDTALGTLRVALNGLLTTAGQPTIPAFSSVKATKVLVE